MDLRPPQDRPAAAPRSTVLRVAGREALQWLHRISTNALDDLGPGAARATLFCDFRGRLLHRAAVAVTPDGAVWLLRHDAPGAPLAAFLDRHVFREDVRVTDRSEDFLVHDTASPPGAARGAVEEREGIPVAVHLEGGRSLRVGPAVTPVALDAAASERERIHEGRPAHGREIVEEFHPFEVGLGHEVHLDKGCYTGQEALLRMVTYQGVRRRLARVTGPGPPPAPPCDVRRGDQRVGRLTSAIAETGLPERWIGLAVLRREVADSADALEAGGAGIRGPHHVFAASRPLGRP